jgi:hypothetical protein
VQHRIDKRDPKLALAPVYREHDLPFTPLALAAARADNRLTLGGGRPE